MTARLLLIGLDGADGRQLDRYSADGTMPNLAALRARGCGYHLAAPLGAGDDAVWASFQYGVELAEHGRYHYRLPAGDGRLVEAHGIDAGRPFWQDLSDAGQRVAVIDVPKCAAPQPLNGIHLADWLVHGRYFTAPRSYPPELAPATVARFGAAPPSRCGYTQSTLTAADVAAIRDGLLAGVAKKRAAGLHHLAADWDLFAIAFKEAHCASHTFWAASEADAADALTAVLRALDEAVGALAAAADADDIVVFSTTEYEPNGSLDHLMSEIVARLNRADSSRADRLRARLGLGPATLPLCTLLPYNENCVALRVRRAGSGGGPAADVLDALAAELLALRDAATRCAVVTAITRPSSEMTGARAATLPDLLVHCASGQVPVAVVSPRLGRIAGDPPSLRPGNHRPGGFVIAAGGLVADLPPIASLAGFAGLARQALADGPVLAPEHLDKENLMG